MALIIEDGSIVANANSFTTVVECRAYCDPRGLVIPADDAEVEILLVNAADYLFTVETDFQGDRVDPTQVLPFPRETVILYGADISGTIPQILKDAQSRIAFDAVANTLQATGAGRVTKKEQVDKVGVEYAEDGVSNPQAQLTAALTILKPLFNESAGSGANLFAYR
jgi:hypothetical protein